MSKNSAARSEQHLVLNRRTAFIGAGAVGALAVAVAVAPKAVAPADTLAAQAEPATEEGGYRLTEHIKQYYASARI